MRLTDHVIEQILSSNISPDVHRFLQDPHTRPGRHDVQEAALPRPNVALHQHDEGASGGARHYGVFSILATLRKYYDKSPPRIISKQAW